MRALRNIARNAVDSASFAVKYAIAGSFLWAGLYNAVSVLYAFQSMTPVPSTSGTLDTNNDSKKVPALTTAAANSFDRSTMSLEAIKNNFTTVLADTATLKTTTNNTWTRVSGEQCLGWITPTTSSCPAGWTYKTQATFTVTTGCTTTKTNANACTGLSWTPISTCWSVSGYSYTCSVGSFVNGVTTTCTSGTYYSVICCK